jgi:hypothetical protein
MSPVRLAALIAAAALFVSSVPAADQPAEMSLDWLSGHWCSDSAQERIEEYWMPARAGMLFGMSRTTQGERTRSFEFMRIALDPVPTFIAQPGGGTAVPFKKSAGGADWVRFENLAHDFPTRIEYRRTGDRLHAHVAGPGDGGKELVIPYEYERCK